MTIIRPTIAARDRALMGPRAPAALPWEDAGGGTSQTALLLSLLATGTGLGGWWWDYRRTDLITIATGVSSWKDSVQAFSMAQATTTKQPVLGAGGIVFDGVDDFLGSASNPFNGKSAYTIHIVGSMPAWGGGTPALLSHGGAAGGSVRGLLYANGASGLQNFAESPAATQNGWSSGATAMATGVYTFQVDLAQGSSAATPILKNNASLGGAQSPAAAVSGTFTTGSGITFATVVDGTLPANLTALSIVAVPTVANAKNSQVIPLLRGIYGTG